MFDQAVVAFGVIVENACQELVKVGPSNAPEWKPKYKLSDLLTAGFRLVDEQPTPVGTGAAEADAWVGL